jgi:RNA polymerase sigma-70 factor, ECF subfamily
MWSLPESEKARMADASERALIGAAQIGSEPAVEELFRRHWPKTHRAAYLIVRDSAAAEDIAQEAFLSALSALGHFDRRRPFAPWLHRIASTAPSTGAAPAPYAAR